MRRILIVALLAVGGLLGVTATASADIDDIRDLTVDGQLFGSASDVTVTGTIRCAASLEYGFSGVGVAQDPADTVAFFEAGDSSDTEAVGAYGPNFDPPEGISDDSPCSQATQGYDVVVQQNRDSDDFDDESDVGVVVVAGTSAEDGDRGPGPFIGDLLIVEANEVSFNRTR